MEGHLWMTLKSIGEKNSNEQVDMNIERVNLPLMGMFLLVNDITILQTWEEIVRVIKLYLWIIINWSINSNIYKIP